MNWGLLSTSRIGEAILDATEASPRISWLGVASRQLAPAEALAERRGIPRSYGSYRELLADPDIDAVYIPLPNSMHVDWAVEAIEAGKHVLCEKPLTRRRADAVAVAAAAAAHERLLWEAFMYRHHPQTRRAMDLVANGAIGDVAEINGFLSFQIADPASDPRTSLALDGGALMDVGCYPVSGARLFAGAEPLVAHGREVRATPKDVDMRFAGLLEFEGGVTASFTCAMDLPRRDGLELVGTRGFVRLADPWHCRVPSFELWRDGVCEQVEVDPTGELSLVGSSADAYRLQLEAFTSAAAYALEGSFAVPDYVHQARAVEALYRSAADRRPVTV